MAVAVENGGYVTPALLEPYGVPAVELRKMVARGTLTSAGRGIYRVPVLPPDRFDEFILAGLWANGRGAISHDSALVVHDLCDINPARVHLTIPRSYRISRAGGEHYTLHRADLGQQDITRLDGVSVTTIRRTLTDSVDNVPAYLVRQAIANAHERGAISPAERDALLRRTSGDGADPGDGPAPGSVTQETFSRHLLRIARRRAGITRGELADRTGVAEGALADYETGGDSPTVEVLCRLLAATDHELRVRLASPDSHAETLATAEAMLPAEDLEQHRTRETTRLGRHTVDEPSVKFTEVPLRRGRPAFVGDRLWRLPVSRALTDVTLPLGLNWSTPGATFRLTDRRQRARCFEIVLREGAPADLLQYVDGALLIDLWPELVLPRELRAAWQPVIDSPSDDQRREIRPIHT